MKYFFTNKAGVYQEYQSADNEIIEVGKDGIPRILVDTGLETYHKDIVLTAVEEDEEKEAEERAEKEKEENEKKEKAKNEEREARIKKAKKEEKKDK